MRGFYQRVKRAHVQRLGVLFFTPHRARAYQSGLELAVLRHRHGQAVVVLVFNHLHRPAVARSGAVLLDGGNVACHFKNVI